MNSRQNLYQESAEQWRERPDDLLLLHQFLLPEKGIGLDLGAGKGNETIFLARLGLQMTAVDISRLAINRLKERASELNLTIRTFRQDMLQFSIHPDSYDLICSFWSLIFLSPKKIAELASSIAAGLKPSGLFACAVYTEQDPGFFAAQRRLKTQGARHFITHDGGHLYFFSQGELRSFFPDLKVIYYAEGDSLDYNYSSPHRHAWAKILAQKPKI